MDASRVYVRALTLGCFYILLVPEPYLADFGGRFRKAVLGVWGRPWPGLVTNHPHQSVTGAPGPRQSVAAARSQFSAVAATVLIYRCPDLPTLANPPHVNQN